MYRGSSCVTVSRGSLSILSNCPSRYHCTVGLLDEYTPASIATVPPSSTYWTVGDMNTAGLAVCVCVCVYVCVC